MLPTRVGQITELIDVSAEPKELLDTLAERALWEAFRWGLGFRGLGFRVLGFRGL